MRVALGITPDTKLELIPDGSGLRIEPVQQNPRPILVSDGLPILGRVERAANKVWFPANTSFRRPVALPAFTTIGRYWPHRSSDAAIAATSPRLGFRSNVVNSSTGNEA